MANPGLIKNYNTGDTVRPFRIVTFGGGDEIVIESVTAGNGGIGVSDSLGGTGAAGRVDVTRSDLADVLYGGTITRGNLLTNDNQGRAVVAEAEDRIIGVAELSGSVGDIGKVFLYNSAPGGALTNVDATVGELNTLAGTVGWVDFTVGAENTNVINVELEFQQSSGVAIATSQSVDAYLSSAADGGALATAPSGGVATGTAGLAIEVIADRAFKLVSSAMGVVDIDITEAGATTFYLVVVLPNGKIAISPAITFAA